jgi:hypothetical protein
MELTDSEKALIARIDFGPTPAVHNSEVARANGEAALALAKSLTARNAIPPPRMRWFTDPAYNVSGHGGSREDDFVKNGKKGDDIFRDPNFLKHLRYWVYGPDLPPVVLDGFAAEVATCRPVTSGDLPALRYYAKQQTRAHALDGGTAAEEFYKLALECGLDEFEARSIRNAVKTA